MADRTSGGRRNDFSLDPLEVINPIMLQGVAVPERQWLWEHWIPHRAVTVLSGDGGTGKSLIALQLATACATGQKFLGQSVMHCKALVIACEDECDELHRRQARINAGLGIDMGDLMDVYWVARAGLENVMMNFPGDGSGERMPFFEQVLSKAREIGAQLIIFDTAADLFGGNENIRPQVRQFINALTGIALSIDGTVLLLAHPSQSGKASGTGESGSTAWNNSVRSRLYFTRPTPEKGEPEDKDARILSRQKSNYARAGASISMRYVDGAFIATSGEASEDDAWMLDRKRGAEHAFLAGVEDLALKKFRCNAHKGQANYAPKAIMEKATTTQGFTHDELEAAMNRLFKKKRLKSVEEGPASRRRSYLSVIEPELGDF
ncbi:MAG: AAA family ATPase [Aestuariivirga sp.]|nr:AAA family ATPase [Aestuariivirga sp.]